MNLVSLSFRPCYYRRLLKSNSENLFKSVKSEMSQNQFFHQLDTFLFYYWDKKYSWFPLILIQIVHARRMYIINEDSRKSNLMTSWVKKQKNIQRKQGCEQKGCAKCTAGKIVWRNRKKQFFPTKYVLRTYLPKKTVLYHEIFSYPF